jgi:hypothetical protein
MIEGTRGFNPFLIYVPAGSKNQLLDPQFTFLVLIEAAFIYKKPISLNVNLP